MMGIVDGGSSARYPSEVQKLNISNGKMSGYVSLVAVVGGGDNLDIDAGFRYQIWTLVRVWTLA